MTRLTRPPAQRGIMPRDKGLIRGHVRAGVRSDSSPPVARRRPHVREPALCERCGAVYLRKTWRTGERAARADPVGASWTVCPACEQLDEGEFFGRVIIRGAFARANEQPIRDRIRGVAARARFTQPLRRIVSIQRRGAVLEVLATSQKLAHRIARALAQGFGGYVTYAWSDRDGELYATWQRDDLPVPPAPPRRRRLRDGGGARPGVPIEILTRRVTLDPSWRELIEASVARIAGRHPLPLRVRVTVSHTRHHRHGVEEVVVLARLPGAVLRAAKQGERVEDAVRAAFAALGAELQRHRRERGGARPRHGGPRREPIVGSP